MMMVVVVLGDGMRFYITYCQVSLISISSLGGFEISISFPSGSLAYVMPQEKRQIQFPVAKSIILPISPSLDDLLEIFSSAV